MRRLIALLMYSALAQAHEGEAFEAHDLITEWVWDPAIVLPICLFAVLYWLGSRNAERGFAAWEKACFWSGWVALVIALMSPLHPMGEALFSAHMAQHELLMVVAAPLLVLGRPLVAALWALPQSWRRSAAPWTRPAWWAEPLPAFWVHFVAVWAWHIPAAYQATITSDLVHTAQHISFLASALLFWWAVMRQYGARRQLGAGLFYVFATAVHTSILGALLTFSTTAWYPVYEAKVAAWGLTPLEDQQLGGLIMWVPPGFLYLGIFLWMFARWIRVGAIAGVLLMALLLSSAGCRREDARLRRGRQLIQAYGCGSCHTIPGVDGARGHVGPPLTQVGMRSYLAGRIENTPDHMVQWIHNPKSVDPQTAMPVTGISEADAREVTRYLYTLR